MLLKKFFRNITILNIALLFVIGVMLTYCFSPIRRTGAYSIPTIKKHIGFEATTTYAKTVPSISDYTVVTENNLFHPERKIPPEKKEEAAVLPRPDVVLHGTLITGDVSFAYLEDLRVPRNTSGRGRRQLVMKKGDVLSGFVLNDIKADRIVMVREQEEIVVLLHDVKKAKTTQQTPIQVSNPVRREEIGSRKAIDREAYDFFQRKRR